MKNKASYKARRTARALVIYGLLIGGSAIFALPFLYMVSTSLKMDREMARGGLQLIPDTPRPALQSPYIDAHYFPAPRDARYTRVEESVLAALATQPAGRDIPKTLAPGIFTRLAETLPNAIWDADPSTLNAAVRAAVDATMTEDTRRKVQRQLVLGSLRVKSHDQQEKEMTEGQQISAFWQVEGGRLTDLPPRLTAEGRVEYDFAENTTGEVRLTTTLTLPFKAERLHRIEFALNPDDSWHRIDCRVEKSGVQYQTLRSQHTGGTQSRVVTLQEFGPDDNPNAMKIRTWIPYKQKASGPEYEAGDQQIKLTLILKQSSPMKAWWLKASRNYVRTMGYIPFWRYASTSALLVILNIIGSVFSCSLAAYAFARLQWPGRNAAFAIMLATMMIPPQVTMIPYFLIIKSLGWYNTLTPLWVMSFFGNAFNIFLLRQFIKGIPRDLEDAAKIDGCNFMQIYWNVIIPLIKPTLACIAVFTFMGVWNDFMSPLIYLADQRLYPLSLGLYAFQVQEGGNMGMMMAGSLLMTLPVILIFFFAQKYFIQGIALTGTKG